MIYLLVLLLIFAMVCFIAAAILIARTERVRCPSREVYVRTTINRNGFTFEPGLELRAGDDCEALQTHLRLICHSTMHDYPTSRSVEAVADGIAKSWPERAYFIEVFSHDGSWFQVFQPYGLPRNR